MEQPDTQSFVVKDWLEETVEEAGRARWRGRVTHVTSGERRYLENLSGIAAFIKRYLERWGVKFGVFQRLRLFVVQKSALRRQRPVFIFSTKAWMSLRRSSALVMPFARAISSNASPRSRGTSVLTWTTGDRLLVTICAGCFLMRPSPPESDSDGILSELFVEPTERWHLRHVPLAWRHPYRSEVCRTQRGHGA